jgi:putative DNA primase/helicase
LPELLKAQASNQPIFIVEGEKCVEALRALGLVATTNSGGAGKWGDCGKYFQKGQASLLFRIMTSPGGDMLEVATDLKQRGCNVKVLNLPIFQSRAIFTIG